MAAYFHSSFAGNVQTQLIHGYVPREPSSDDEPTQPIRGYVRKQPRPGYLQRQPIRGYVQSQPNPGYTGVPLGQIQPAILQVQAVGPQSTQVRDEIPHRQRLRILGIIQMVAGSVCFIFEVIGLIVLPVELMKGVGIWAGVFFFVSGLLSFLAARLNNGRLLVACLVMCIIGSIVALIGISFSSVEISSFNYHNYHNGLTFSVDTSRSTPLLSTRRRTYERVKASINIIVCIFEFVVTIVNASFTCRWCCQCCQCCQCCVPAEPMCQATYVGPQPTQMRNETRRRRALMILGIIQMVAGSMCFCFEFIGLFVGPIEYVMGVGIWVGVISFVPGLLSFLAVPLKRKRNVRKLWGLVGFILAISACVGIFLTCLEIRDFNDVYYHDHDKKPRITFVVPTTPSTLVTNSQLTFEQVKASINIMVCILTIVITIVSAFFICVCCQYCVPADPGRPGAQQANTTTTTHVQQPVQMVHSRQHQRTQPILRTPTRNLLETELQIDLSIGIRRTTMLVPDRYRPNRRQIALSAGARSGEASGHYLATPPSYEQSQQGRFSNQWTVTIDDA